MSSPCETPVMSSVEQAVHALTSLLQPVAGSEQVALENAGGRVLAEAVPALMDVPLWDNSAMDGYALRSGDLAGAAGSLPVAGTQAAGDRQSRLPPGHCMKIFTGAALPAGADSVIPRENVVVDGQLVSFGQFRAGQNIRRRGEECRKGDLLLAAGSLLRPQEIGLLASQGHARVPVWRQLRIGLVSCGNELRTPGEPLSDGQIYDANGYLLASLLQGWGFAVQRYPLLADDLPATMELLHSAAAQQDILLSSGGVSVGDADYLREAVSRLGSLNLWQVAIQPGKPLAFGRIGNTPWIGLPGNPGASLVTALVVARPALLAAAGLGNVEPAAMRVAAAFDWHKTSKRTRYLQARLEQQDGRPVAVLHQQQSSAMLANCSWAGGMVVVPPQQQINAGDGVRFVSYQEVLHR